MRDYNIRERHLIWFKGMLWGGDVPGVYQNVLHEHRNASSSKTWRKMSVVVYNDSHMVEIRDQAFYPSYDSRKQTPLNYGTSLKTAALALDYKMPED